MGLNFGALTLSWKGVGLHPCVSCVVPDQPRVAFSTWVSPFGNVLQASGQQENEESAAGHPTLILSTCDWRAVGK